MSLTVVAWRSQDNQKWDDFAYAHMGGIAHQTRTWMDFQEEIPGRHGARGYAVEDGNGALQALCWVLRMDTGHLNTHWAYSPRGPIGTNVTAVQMLIANIKEFLQQENTALFWRIDGAYNTDFQAELGLNAYPQETKPYNPTDHLMLDLTASEDEIRAQMKRKGRYNITKAEKRGYGAYD